MSRLKIALLGSVIGLAALGPALYHSAVVYRAEAELATATRRQHERETKVAELQERVTAAEQENFALRPSAKPAPEISAKQKLATAFDTFERRYRHGRESLARADYAAALSELLWCYDADFPVYWPGQSIILLADLRKLIEIYPEASAELRIRRNRTEEVLFAGSDDRKVIVNFALLNRVLNEDEHTLEIYDRLAPSDPRRPGLGSYVSDRLIADRRYTEAVAVRSYESMVLTLASVEQTVLDLAPADPEQRKKLIYRGLVITAENVEALAGAGELGHARKLISRMIELDGSDEIKALLQQHLARAGHPELLTAQP